MKRLLISWIADTHDFTNGKMPVNPDGPNASVHKYFYSYDKHLLLSIAKNSMQDIKLQHLVSFLRKEYKHEIEDTAMSIEKNDIINLNIIAAKVNTLLLENRHNHIDIFISPGTPAMQVAWYFAHLSLGLNTRLFQVVKASDSSTRKPEQLWINIEKSTYTSSLVIEQISQVSGETDSSHISNTLKPIYQKAKKVAAYDCINVLITGETGTGKELLARYVHESSPRHNEKFEVINCAALGDALLESRLFGYMKGAFTGALANNTGILQSLNGGTVFLDEIGDISPYMQQLLLRVIQFGEILRVGALKTEKVDVRVIVATNKDLLQMMLEGKFREDLYYRLSTAELYVPPLLEYTLNEKQDLFDYLWQKAKRKFNREKIKLPVPIKNMIMAYSFPGNIREMENLADYLVINCAEEVKEFDLPKRLKQTPPAGSLKLADVERSHISKVLLLCGNNKSKACKQLGISINTLNTKIATLNKA